ncbi:hypothetical protein LY90DRAFT_678742 [Neocallimastix californiae]|uniref:F-box domain-containing protein n=1 Tax=Neocallimastix californiae TaxID=1754190 RepID=A0A1Y1YPT3_9FUNG|nr:hypothetical protein LY90DRAFT_678742 [Neocallimastix californiae]|eukprot:ORY00051.1 hypothetical protein LY90DRAFT_678742 [Neocallimastix californiae]
MNIKTSDKNKDKNTDLNNETQNPTTSNFSKEEQGGSSIDIKHISNSNYVNASSTSSIVKSLLSNNFNFSNSFQNHLENINNYDIRFGNINTINENQIKNDQALSTNASLNIPIQNENKFVNKNNIYSSLFSSNSTSNSSSSITSYLAFNQVQPKSKVNIVNSSFNNIFGNIQFSGLEKNKINEDDLLVNKNLNKDNNENEKIEEEKNLYDNEIPSSSKLMFGSLNISKPSNFQNKGKEISSSSSIINNDSYESISNKEIEMKKSNIVRTIDHSVFDNNNINNYISDKDVERIVGNYKQIINNVIKRENIVPSNDDENQNELNIVNSNGDREIFNINNNINNPINNNHIDRENNNQGILKMNNNFFNSDVIIQQSNTVEKNFHKKSDGNLNEDIIVESLENIDFSFIMDSNINDDNSVQESLVIDNNNLLNNENIENEKIPETISNESSIHLSNNSLNSIDTNISNKPNVIYYEDSYKKTTGESNKILTRNKSSSSESLVEKSLNNNNNSSQENLCIKVETNITNNVLEEKEETFVTLLKDNNIKCPISTVSLLVLPNKYNHGVPIIYNIKSYFSKLLKNNTSFVNSKLNKNTQNFIFLKQLKPKFSLINNDIIQVSVDCKKCLSLMPLLSNSWLSLVPLTDMKSDEKLSLQFNINDSEKLSQIILFFWNLNLLNVKQYELFSKSEMNNKHYHILISPLHGNYNINHIQWHIQKIIDNTHALSCYEYLSYLRILHQFQNNMDCESCKFQYSFKLNDNKCSKCQNLIDEQIKQCKECHKLIKALEDDKIIEIESTKDENINKCSLLTDKEEMFIPKQKEIYKLDTLPPEILMNIFEQFTKNTDKQNFRFTCKRFRKTLNSPNVLMLKNYEQINYLKNLINIRKAIMNVDILFKDFDKLEITNTTFSEIRNLILICDIQDMTLRTSEFSKRLINTAFNSFSTLTNLTIRQINRRDIFTRLFSPRKLTLPCLSNLQFEESVLSPRTLKPWEKISMPSLRSIIIDEKSVLSHIPSFLRNLSSIELKCHFKTNFWLSGEYYNLENLIVELDYKDDFCELFIKEGTYMPQLKSLLLMNNRKVESLPISPKLTDLTIVCDEFSKEELNKLPEYYPELSVLNIESPLDFSFPSNFTSLKSLRLEFIPTVLIRTIPALPHLTSLHIERGEHVVLNGTFPELKYLIVESCDKINFSGKFEAIEWIKFRNCNNMRTVNWDFPSLNSLSLEGCFFLTSIEDKYPLLQTINVKCCKNFYKIPNNLPKLNTLNILQCDNFISVSSNFKSLTILNVSHCRIFSYIPKELDNLEWLLLEDCNNIYQIPYLLKLRHFKCLRCKNIPFPFSPCKFFPNIRSFAVTTLNKS